MIELRTATDDELGAYIAIWNAVTPDEPADEAQQRERRERHPERLYLLARLDGEDVGCGFGGPSDSPGRGFVSPRVLPRARRRGVGAALLSALADHLAAQDYETCSAHVDGNDEGSLAFARRFGFEEVDRQVEQVLAIVAAEPVEPPAGIRFVTIAEQPGLLEAAYDLAAEGYADLALSTPVEVPLEDWLRDEATLPGGSVVALAGDEIVGYSGLVDLGDGRAEDGLAVVRRAWRRRGLATAMKRTKLAWAAANGVHEIVTWTQRGNDGMRAVNEALGYEYRSVSITVRAPLPLS
jgi:RimJ/RimL family protein N-acetyltransferase